MCAMMCDVSCSVGHCHIPWWAWTCANSSPYRRPAAAAAIRATPPWTMSVAPVARGGVRRRGRVVLSRGRVLELSRRISRVFKMFMLFFSLVQDLFTVFIEPILFDTLLRRKRFDTLLRRKRVDASLLTSF